MLTTFLGVLFCMHIFWFYLMIKGILKRYYSKNFKEGISLTSSVNRG